MLTSACLTLRAHVGVSQATCSRRRVSRYVLTSACLTLRAHVGVSHATCSRRHFSCLVLTSAFLMLRAHVGVSHATCSRRRVSRYVLTSAFLTLRAHVGVSARPTPEIDWVLVCGVLSGGSRIVLLIVSHSRDVRRVHPECVMRGDTQGMGEAWFTLDAPRIAALCKSCAEASEQQFSGGVCFASLVAHPVVEWTREVRLRSLRDGSRWVQPDKCSVNQAALDDAAVYDVLRGATLVAAGVKQPGVNPTLFTRDCAWHSACET